MFFIGMTAIATVCYVVFTGWIIWEMRKDRKERTRPNIIVNLFPRDQILNLIIKNIGNMPAANIMVSFDQKVEDFKGRNINELGFVKNLKFLPPNGEVVHFLDMTFEYFKKDKPTIITGKIDYKDPYGKSYSSPINLDISIFKELSFVRRKSMHDLVEQIEELSKSVSSIGKRVK